MLSLTVRVSRKFINLYKIQARGAKNWKQSCLYELYRRRDESGPEKERHRSEFYNWNYNAEIFSFIKRLKETVSIDRVRQAFTHSCYVEDSMKKQIELGLLIDESENNLEDNNKLIEKGKTFLSEYLYDVVTKFLPKLSDEESKTEIVEFLKSRENLSNIARNLGFKDLQLCIDETGDVLNNSILAFLGVLLEDSGHLTASKFVNDFIITTMVSESPMDILKIRNPLQLLSPYINGDITSRILFENCPNTVESTFVVGIYEDEKLIGYSAGETIQIAEEMAIKDAVSRFIGIKNHQFNVNTFLRTSF